MAVSKPATHPPITDLYERWTLDCVVELSQGIAADFVNRPRQYRVIPAAVAATLQNLWYRADTDPQFPGAAKRQLVCTPLFGPSDGRRGPHDSQFHRASAALRERARAFSERQVETGEDSLRQAFQDAALTLRAWLVTLTDNAAVTIGDAQTRHIFERAVEVLTTPEISAVFGQTPSNLGNWPLDSSFDENGARLIEEVSKKLPTRTGLVPQGDFIVIQRIASFGGNTLRGVLGQPELSTSAGSLDKLIQEAYRWQTALDALAAGAEAGPAATT